MLCFFVFSFARVGVKYNVYRSPFPFASRGQTIQSVCAGVTEIECVSASCPITGGLVRIVFKEPYFMYCHCLPRVTRCVPGLCWQHFIITHSLVSGHGLIILFRNLVQPFKKHYYLLYIIIICPESKNISTQPIMSCRANGFLTEMGSIDFTHTLKTDCLNLRCE